MNHYITQIDKEKDDGKAVPGLLAAVSNRITDAPNDLAEAGAGNLAETAAAAISMIARISHEKRDPKLRKRATKLVAQLLTIANENIELSDPGECLRMVKALEGNAFDAATSHALGRNRKAQAVKRKAGEERELAEKQAEMDAELEEQKKIRAEQEKKGKDNGVEADLAGES